MKRFKVYVKAWWLFFWRYAILFITLLFAGGLLINCLKGLGLRSGTVLYLILCYGILVNLLAAVAVFVYVIGHKFRKSGVMLSLPESRANTTGNKISVALLYFARFVFFSLVIAFILGFSFSTVTARLGADAAVFLNYSKYLGNLALAPASFLSFLMLAARKERKCRLVIATLKVS